MSKKVICPSCNKEVKNTKCCSECGVPITQQSENSKSKKKGRGCLWSVLAILVGFIILVVILSNTVGKDYTSKSKMVKSITSICEVDETQAKTIESILINCDIIDIDNIEHDTLLDNAFDNNEIGYRISSNGTNNIILYLSSDKRVYAIRYNDNDLYSNGNVIHGLKYYKITIDEQSALQVSCQNALESVLSSPATAKYPSISNWSFSKDFDKNIIEVKSYVDAQNALGATLRNDFVFQFQITGDITKNEYDIIYIKLDDKTIIDNRR